MLFFPLEAFSVVGNLVESTSRPTVPRYSADPSDDLESHLGY